MPYLGSSGNPGIEKDDERFGGLTWGRWEWENGLEGEEEGSVVIEVFNGQGHLRVWQ